MKYNSAMISDDENDITNSNLFGESSSSRPSATFNTAEEPLADDGDTGRVQSDWRSRAYELSERERKEKEKEEERERLRAEQEEEERKRNAKRPIHGMSPSVAMELALKKAQKQEEWRIERENNHNNDLGRRR